MDGKHRGFISAIIDSSVGCCLMLLDWTGCRLAKVLVEVGVHTRKDKLGSEGWNMIICM